MHSLELLYQKAVDIFAQAQEVQDVLLFGSFARGTHDQYSDIDLTIISTDFDETMAKLPQFLARIGTVLIQYPLHTSCGSAAYMTLFKDFPLYKSLILIF